MDETPVQSIQRNRMKQPISDLPILDHKGFEPGKLWNFSISDLQSLVTLKYRPSMIPDFWNNLQFLDGVELETSGAG